METLKYQIEDSTIADLLGKNNFTSEESAILELVKNAYDAFANKFEIHFQDNKIIFSDDGSGMNENDIKNHWMRVGYSCKGYELYDGKSKRILSGSKGIGRFALSRLGKEVIIETKKKDNKAIKWQTNWNVSTLDYSDKDNIGTTMIVSQLNSKWNSKKIEKLISFLSRTYNDDQMCIEIYFNNQKFDIKKYFFNPKIGINYLSETKLSYSSTEKKLYYEINSDEFTDKAKEYCKDINIKYKRGEINVLNYFQNTDEFENINMDKLLKNLGDFNGKLFFFFKSTNRDLDKFFYKHKLEETLEDGIILYRNSFSISSFEGKKDWLGLGKRYRKSPAAATHPSGAWRVRENQIGGYINIDKIYNPELKDLSNRQGLEENDYFEVFVNIILLAIEEFEYYRQSIIRKINKKNVGVSAEPSIKIIDKLIKNPNIVKTLNTGDQNQLVGELVELKKSQELIKNEINTTEQQYRYDVKILNALSTLGLRAASIAHEIQNDRNYIYDNIDDIIKRLKELNIWDTINSQENTKYAAWNIPKMLSENKRINIKMIEFMDTMLTDIEKNQFDYANLNLLEEIQITIKRWQKNYSWINFNIDIDNNIFHFSSKDTIKVIFDNLILNSIQQNEAKNQINIFIKAKYDTDKKITIEYSDDGIGLSAKFLRNPMKILEVHQTSRKNGHGLGMWIVNNTIIMTGGEVINIDGNNGFKIIFTVGEQR